MLLGDDSARPEIVVRWLSDGRWAEHRAELAFGAPDQGSAIDGTNLEAFVALGGTRLELGAGHPRGAILRVGLTKMARSRALFRRVDPGSDVEITVRGAGFNQPVRVDPSTALVHLNYALDDVEACSLPAEASNQYLLRDPDDTLGGAVRAGYNATPGGLDGARGHGTAWASVDADGTVTLGVRVPYAMLRHLQDPWASGLPGTFFEPVRLHAEVEVLPVWAEPLTDPRPGRSRSAD
jgi:hypothetical protein